MIQVIFRTQKVYLLIFLNHYAILSLLKKYQAESIILVSTHTHTHTNTHKSIRNKGIPWPIFLNRLIPGAEFWFPNFPSVYFKFIIYKTKIISIYFIGLLSLFYHLIYMKHFKQCPVQTKCWLNLISE